MASKDYVKRPRANNKNQATKRKTEAKTQPPWLRMLLSVLVVAAFVYGLYKLQAGGEADAPAATNGEIESIDVTNQAATNDSDKLEKIAPLPVLGEEEWEYIDALPDFSVEVNATGPLESSKDYIMQCGSFRTQERAQELRAKIAFQGLEARILTSDGRNGLWYRVVLGPYEHKRAAERHRHQLRKGKINGCKIW